MVPLSCSGEICDWVSCCGHKLAMFGCREVMIVSSEVLKAVCVVIFASCSGGTSDSAPVPRPRHTLEVFGARRNLAAICPMMERRRGVHLDSVRYELVLSARYLVSRLLKHAVYTRSLGASRKWQSPGLKLGFFRRWGINSCCYHNGFIEYSSPASKNLQLSCPAYLKPSLAFQLWYLLEDIEEL